jgi:hypothetical protein
MTGTGGKSTDLERQFLGATRRKVQGLRTGLALLDIMNMGTQK